MVIRKLLIITSLFVIAACSKEQMTVEQEQKESIETANQALVIKLNEQVSLDGLTLEFMELVGDSRCPKGVQCSWAGNAQAVFLVTDNDAAQTVALNTHGGDKYPQSSRLNGYEISLKAIKPYPATNIKIDPSQYMAQLVVQKQAKAKPEHVIIDVRSEREFNLGHYPNAENLDYKTIEDTIETLNLAKDTKIYLYCRSGKRAGIAKALLEEEGYTNVINGINQGELHKTLGTLPKM